MDVMVIFRGEVCWMKSAHIAQSFLGENQDTNFGILYEVIAIESASVKGRYRGSFVNLSLFRFLPSSIDFSNSEWSQGVKNGKDK